jgi:hypothetical protein
MVVIFTRAKICCQYYPGKISATRCSEAYCGLRAWRV